MQNVTVFRLDVINFKKSGKKCQYDALQLQSGKFRHSLLALFFKCNLHTTDLGNVSGKYHAQTETDHGQYFASIVTNLNVCRDWCPYTYSPSHKAHNACHVRTGVKGDKINTYSYSTKIRKFCYCDLINFNEHVPSPGLLKKAVSCKAIGC